MPTPCPQAPGRRTCSLAVPVAVATVIILFLGYAHLPSVSRTAEVFPVDISASQTWDVSVKMKKIRKATEDTVHYDLSSELGNAEWASVFPQGGGLLHLGAKNEPYTISMFHELRCLDIIGHEVLARLQDPPESPPTALAEHCIGYIRQMILCRADTTLESAVTPAGDHIVAKGVVHTCNDWSAVYAAAEANYAAYQERLRAVRM